MELVFMAVAVFLGAVVQGSVGFGLALVVVPVLTLVRPEALPATILLVIMPMAILMAVRERRAFDDASGLVYLLSGRLVGTLGGVGLLALVPDQYLSVLFGGLVAVAALASAASPKVPLRGSTRAAGGFASGVMGTAAGIGGPPLALVYQSRSGPEVRSTLAVVFSVGTAISLVALALFGRVGLDHLLLSLKLLPALLLGLWAARFLTGLLAKGWLRPAILLFAAASGLLAVLLGAIG